MKSQLDGIKDLLSKCGTEEIKTFNAYLRAFDPGTGKYRSKSLHLLELLRKKSTLDEEHLCIKIYGSYAAKSKQSFKRLLSRFKGKLYECLTLDVNIYREGKFTELTQYRAEILKITLYNSVLRGKVDNREFLKMVERGITLAKNYELYHELINLLSIKNHFLRILAKFERLKKIDDEIEFYMNSQRAIQRATDWHHILILNAGAKAGGYSNFSDFEKAIEEMKNDFELYKAANIKYFLLIIQMEYAHKTHDYDLAERISHEQIELYKLSPAVYLKVRLASAYLNLGNNQMFLYKFNDAINNIRKSYPFYQNQPFNLGIAKEIEFYLHFYAGNLNEAEALIRQLINATGSTSFQAEKRSFLLANVLVLKKQNRDAHHLLQETKEIEKDKEGWNLGIRILSIINQLEGEKLDLADMNIESMRKHISRTTKLKAVRKRDVIILKLLTRLGRYAFNFKYVYKKYKPQFDLLASDDPEYRWEMKTHEMIIFDRWFKGKATGKPYEYKLQATAVEFSEEKILKKSV